MISILLNRWSQLTLNQRRFFLFFHWILIFTGTHLPSEQLPPIAAPGFDKLMHFILYAPLAFLFASTRPMNKPSHYLTAFLWLSLYGIFDELTQIPVNRSAEVLDWVVDSIGVLIGLGIFRLTKRPATF